ncbi:unnamed protein product [Durusdinium trenchii]|uniref:Uncharacterized protein n=2 Tax=Durusdinium trenchii TaxID=1381693 RepID=A0ABP0QXZ7_9DINO
MAIHKEVCKACGAPPLPDALFCHLCGRERVSEDNSASVVQYSEVLEVLRTARYPALLEVKWTLTEADAYTLSSSSDAAEAIASGQAILSCSSAQEAETLVAQLSNCFPKGIDGTFPVSEGVLPSNQDALCSPSPLAPLERPSQACGQHWQPPETAESVDLSRRSLSPGTRTLKKRNSRLGEGHHTKATEKSNRLWADRSEAPRPKLAEWARVQANLKPKATCAPAARRWGSDRSPSPSAASTGPSTAHSLLSPGYLDRMREKSASARQACPTSPAQNPRTRASRDVAIQAQSCISTMASWGLQLRSDTEVGRSETCVFTAPSLNVPQMRGPPSNTDSAGIKLGRLRGAQTQRPSRDSEAPESPSWWPSPGMRLASPVRSQTKSDDISPERSPALALSRAKGALGKRQLQARASGASTSDIASRLRHSEPVVRQAAVAALGALGDVEQAGQLAKLLQDSDAGVRKAAALALGNLGQSAAVYTDALLSASQHDYDDDVRFHAAVALGMLKTALHHSYG